MTHSKEVLDVLIERRVAHLRLLAAQTAQQYWKDQPQKPLSERFDELVQRALARRRRGGAELR